MFNTYHALHGLDGPSIVAAEQVSQVSRPQLLRFFLENDMPLCCRKLKSSNFPQGKNIPPLYEQRPKVGTCETLFQY